LKLGRTKFFLVIFSNVFIEMNRKQKWCRQHFKLLDYSSNQMKKKLRLSKKLL
jgi:hypothetical protein